MLTTSVERLENFMIKLTVTVPASDVDAAIDATYKALGKKYRMPGFRPGKAPKPILDQQIGREYILGEATEKIVNESYPKALDAEKLRPIESPEIEELEIADAGQDYTYVAEVQLRPELELSDYEAPALELPTPEATDEDINGEVEALRERFASLSPVEDRGVEAGDFVLLSFVGTVEGEAYDGNVVDKYLYEMNKGLMPVEFDEGIIGAQAGEERTVAFEIPDTSSNPDFVGKTASFDVTVHEIKAKVLPQIDDEFAANLGGFDSLDAMLEDLRTRITVQKTSAFGRIKEARAREALAAKLVGEIPETMQISRRESMMRDFLTMLDTRGMNIQQYLEGMGMTMDALDEDMKAQADLSLREELALEALYRHLDLEVTDADIDEEITAIAAQGDMTPEDARAKWVDLGLMAVMTEQIQQRKAMHWLLDNVVVTGPGAETDSTMRKAKAAAKEETAVEDVAAAEDAAIAEDEAVVEPAPAEDVASDPETTQE